MADDDDETDNLKAAASVEANRLAEKIEQECEASARALVMAKRASNPEDRARLLAVSLKHYAEARRLAGERARLLGYAFGSLGTRAQ